MRPQLNCSFSVPHSQLVSTSIDRPFTLAITLLLFHNLFVNIGVVELYSILHYLHSHPPKVFCRKRHFSFDQVMHFHYDIQLLHIIILFRLTPQIQHLIRFFRQFKFFRLQILVCHGKIICDSILSTCYFSFPHNSIRSLRIAVI